MIAWRGRGMRVVLLTSAILTLLSVAAGAAAFYFLILFDLPKIKTLDDFQPALSSHVVDRKGRPIGEFFEERRQLIAIETVPKHVIDAFIAGEDASFFTHEGLDYISILRAAGKNLLAKLGPDGSGRMQGGSTITQQVAKSFISPERTLRRKLKDMMLARRLEKNLTKNEILYLYLNQIFFGQGYGVAEAARQYFGKTVQELTVSEAALLAGLPKAPSAYSPYANPKAAEMRRLYVLTEMRNNRFIDEATYQEAVATPPVLRRPKELADYALAAYFGEEIRRDLVRRLGNETILRGGLKIETTLDLDLQRAAVKAVRAGLSELDHRRGYRGPLRHVEAKAIAAELANLAADNRLAASHEPLASEKETASTAPANAKSKQNANTAAQAKRVAAEKANAAQVLAFEKLFPPERTFVGVITKLAPETATATVSFAPNLAGYVLLGDVAWARRDQKPGVASSIEKVFQVGDVARFRRVVPKATGKDAKISLDEVQRFTLFQEPLVEGALLSVDVASGEVLALVGGYDFERSEFNRATQARRQPGSSFKPIVYSAAISKNFTPASILVDRPYIYRDEYSGNVWRPKGYTGEFLGRMLLREALADSVNNVAIHLLADVGLDYTIEHARKLGIEAPLVHNMSLALGSSDLSLLELTRAYTVFPAGGKFKPLHYIKRVTDRNGKVLLENLTLGNDPELAASANTKPMPQPNAAKKQTPKPETANVAAAARPTVLPKGQVIPATDAYLMIDLMRAVVSEGTATRALVLGHQSDGKPMVAGKTGTTNDQADAWFMGFSPNIATGVWVGFDEKTLLGRGETGGRAALPIWTDYMGVALKKYPPGEFVAPEGIVFATIDRDTGLLASQKTQRSVYLPFRAGTQPTEASSLQQKTDASEVLRDELF